MEKEMDKETYSPRQYRYNTGEENQDCTLIKKKKIPDYSIRNNKENDDQAIQYHHGVGWAYGKFLLTIRFHPSEKQTPAKLRIAWQ